MISCLYRNLVLTPFERVLKGRKTFRYWAQLERSQWLPRAELEQIQLDALWRLVGHAFAHCPYYRGAWRTLGLDPASLQTPDDYRRWPVIDRETVRAVRDASLQPRPARSYAHARVNRATSRSTRAQLSDDAAIPDSKSTVG